MAKQLVTYSLKGLNSLKKVLPSWTMGLQHTIAKQAPKEIISNIHKRKTGIFTQSLPSNEPSTLAIKKRKGQGDKSLIATGLLTTPGKWNITRKLKSYLVKPPAIRRKIVKYLQDGVGKKKKQYKIFELPTNYVPKWVKLMIVMKFNKFMKKYA